jgi:hypothetical protein
MVVFYANFSDMILISQLSLFLDHQPSKLHDHLLISMSCTSLERIVAVLYAVFKPREQLPPSAKSSHLFDMHATAWYLVFLK